MTQYFEDDDGNGWTVDYEGAEVGRGRLIFRAADGVRRCRQTVETFGLLVFEGKADEDALLQALKTATTC